MTTVDQYILTKRKKALAQLIDEHVERERWRNQYRRISWLLAYYYLNGARRFDVFEPTTGVITPHWMDKDGNLEFQSQELLSAIDRVSSQIAAMDVRPLVQRAGNSLPAIRSRGTGTVIMDSVTDDDQIEGRLTEFAHILTTLGCCGLCGHVHDHATVGLVGDVEVIHPRELFPFPSLGADYTKQRGLVRERVVPLDWLKKEVGSRKISSNLENMEWWETHAGQINEAEAEDEANTGTASAWSGGSRESAEQGRDKVIGMVRIRELWLDGPRGTVNRYVLCSGDYVIIDEDYEGLEVYCPVTVARLIETGTFYGAGLFDLLYSISRELEKLLKSLFNNIRTSDKYGIVVLPQSTMHERSMLRDVGDGLRAMTWDPDIMGDGFRPFTIQPHNLGDVPGKVAAFAKQLMQSINPWQDLLAEKGRVDSAAGLGFLDEKIQQMMSNATRSVAQAWGKMWKNMLSQSSRALVQSPRPLSISRMSLDLAGVVFDPFENSVDFQANPLPTMSNVRVTIKEVNPRSEITRKAEAIQLFKDIPGLSDPITFKLLALKEGLDFAIWDDDAQAAYEVVVRNILMLYGNGVNPGRVVITPHTSMPDVQMMVLGAFMSGPEMQLASPDVVDEFKLYRESMLRFAGLSLPEAVPSPEDLAMMQMMGTEAGAPPQPQLPAGAGQAPAF
jgi:hypothetical protein